LNAFDELDQESNFTSDGFVTKQQLKVLLTTLTVPLNTQVITELVSNATVNRDGKVDIYEFIRMNNPYF